MRRKLLYLSLLILVAASAAAQQERADESAPSVERLRASVSYLASDKLEGRRTGTPGATAAAEYIAKEFERYRLRRSVGRDLPGMSILEARSPRRYMPEFPFVAGVELGKNNAMLYVPRAQTNTNRASVGARIAPLDLILGEDWMPHGFSSSGRAENLPVVFVGYGITAAELNYDDYKGVDVKDKIALAFSGTADGDNPHGKFMRGGDLRFKALAARAAGAKALIIIAKNDNFKDDKLSRLAFDNAGGEASIPVIAISRQVAARLLNTNSTAELDEIERTLSKLLSKSLETSPMVDGTGSVKNGNTDQGGHQLRLEEIPGFSLTIAVDLIRQNAPAFNVVGILYGSDPKLKDEAIIIGAHYDHLGRGGEGSRAAREGEVHHGADDNASGVAGMLELARIFSRERARLKRTVIFIAFSGEEEGLLGSSYYVNHPFMPLSQTVAMINMDMIGRMKEDKLIIGGVGTAREWRTIIEKANLPVTLGLPVVSDEKEAGRLTLRPLALTLNEDGYGPSDHASFYAKQVPVLFLWTGTHEDYHKPSDTAERINYEDEARILAFVERVVRAVDDNQQRPSYAVARSDSAGRTMSFRVYLGTIPNYADSTKGLMLEGVRDDSPASRAGLKAGDRIVRMAGHDVRNVYDYTYALGEMKAGQEYEIEVVRAGETIKLKITPAARK